MASTYSSRLRYELQANGEQSNLWGTNLNTVLSLIDSSIAGMATIATTGGSTTLTALNSTADESRMAIIKVTGVLVSNATLVIPAQTKTYVVWNATTGAYTVTLKTSGGTGVVVAQGKKAFVFCDATDCFTAFDDTVLSTPVINESKGSAVASAATTSDIWAVTGSTVHITGTTGITAFPAAPQAGIWRKLIFDDAVLLTDGASFVVPGGNYTTAADDLVLVYADTTSKFYLFPMRASGAALVGATTSTKLDDFATPDDNTDLNANTTNHGLVVKATAPASGLYNYVGITNGETAYTNKALFDATNPSTQALGDAAVVGTAAVAARRDHKHAMPSVAQADVTGLTTADSPQFTAINLGHATDTTITRVSAGVAAIEGVTIATLGANTFTGQQAFVETMDTVYTITDGAAFEIDPANGNIQVVTLGASRTPAATNFEAGQSVLLGVDDGTAYTITWTTVAPTWVVPGGTAAAPTLATSGYTWIALWKVGSTIYGAEVGKP